MVSLKRWGSRFEHMLQPSGPAGEIDAPVYGSRFDGAAAHGFDECLPTIATCQYPDAPLAGRHLPDHGELWSVSWQHELRAGVLTMAARCVALPCQMEKTVWLEGGAVRVHYRLTNHSSHPMRFLWSAHPLLTTSPGDRILLPASVEKVRLEWARDKAFGEHGDELAWPSAVSRDGKQHDLGSVPPLSELSALKLFTPHLDRGWCSVLHLTRREALCVEWDVNSAPYLGIWICAGGWPQEELGRHSTVALEPCTSPADSLAEACRQNSAPMLEPCSSKSWWMTLRPRALHGVWGLRRRSRP